MNKKKLLLCFILLGFLCASLIGSCGESINTNSHPQFTEDGQLKVDSPNVSFKIIPPEKIKFYVEVSGSMNGFFQPNKPTDFKTDLWRIVSYFSAVSDSITILTNNGDQGARFSHSDFQTKMNTGAFVSNASTKIPLMLETILQNLDTEKGEVAIMVSDMKYSPVGAAAPDVLLTQYSTDISTIIGKFGKAVCLVGATSNYCDKTGNSVCNRSPYYYLILGAQENVAYMRNAISTLIVNQEKGNFVDNIEAGFNYGAPRHSFGITYRCEQLDDQPTFVAYEEHEPGVDTCMIRLNIALEDYRRRMLDEEIFKNSLKLKAVYGSEVSVKKIEIESKGINDLKLDLKATAHVDLLVYNMPTESEVIEWTLELPTTDITYFNEFFEGAVDENDVSKSFSVVDFIKGMFYGGNPNKDLKPNYILISKKG